MNSLLVTASAQGVRQVCPVEVRASAPAGSDSNWIVVVAGPKPGNEKLGMLGMPEHPARLKPQAAMATVRFMIASVYCCGPRPRPPRAKARAIADRIPLKCALTRVNGRLMRPIRRNSELDHRIWPHFTRLSPAKADTAAGRSAKWLITRSGPSCVTGISV